jgi:hypothetical protein
LLQIGGLICTVWLLWCQTTRSNSLFVPIPNSPVVFLYKNTAAVANLRMRPPVFVSMVRELHEPLWLRVRVALTPIVQASNFKLPRLHLPVFVENFLDILCTLPDEC